MFTSPVIELLIGMIFVFSLLSIIVTQLNNVISSILNLRAKHLYDGIVEIIDDEACVRSIVTHPLIRLKRPGDDALTDVSWIDPEIFVRVLVDLVSLKDAESLRELAQTFAAKRGEYYTVMLDAINNLPDDDRKQQLQACIDGIVGTGKGIETLKQLIDETVDDETRARLRGEFDDIQTRLANYISDNKDLIALRQGIEANVKNPNLKQALGSILDTADDIEETEKRLKTWFNGQMGRASQAFANNLRTWSYGIGIVLALVLNIDSLLIAQTLWNDSALRSTLAASASSNADLLQQINAEAMAEAESEEEASIDRVRQNVIELGETFELLTSYRLPIGWAYQAPQTSETTAMDAVHVNPSRNLYNLFNIAAFPQWLVSIGAKLIGLAITAVAIAQGAPFWFDILRRLSGGGQSSDD